MDKISGSKKLSVLVTALGAVALVLRRQLYLTAVDARGLLQRMHPLSLALLALTAAVLALIVLAVRRQDTCEDCSVRSPLAALGHTVMAGGILSTGLNGLPPAAGYLGIAWQWLGYAAPLCLLLAGAGRLRGGKPLFLLHMVPCLFLVVHIVGYYQTWSGNPQMHDYLFALLGAMALMFFCFYTAALEADCGSCRMQLGMGLAAVYLCLAELGKSGDPQLYWSGAVWVLTELCSRKVPVSGEKE